MADHRQISTGYDSSLVSRLNATLHSIHLNPPPPVQQPPSCKKRASVALVLRVRPTFPLRGTYDPLSQISEDESVPAALDNFFSQEWVRSGEPEVLFIKRAVRAGDRWTGHVALPGGKRELEDGSDQVASIRETQEEVGLDLNTDHCLYIGRLPERVITAHWGKIPYVCLKPGNQKPDFNLIRLTLNSQNNGPLPFHLSLPATRHPPPIPPTQRSPFYALGIPPLSALPGTADIRARRYNRQTETTARTTRQIHNSLHHRRVRFSRDLPHTIRKPLQHHNYLHPTSSQLPLRLLKQHHPILTLHSYHNKH